MSNEVYANGREISCKAAQGKSIAAFPDVCLTPPPPPAGPIPVPYPNTTMSSDSADGSKSVQISGKEVMLKDLSDFKKSTGDEAATKGQGMNVITHQIQGKCYFTSWSMDVKVEGENVVRHMDLMTHNHASTPGATPPWLYQDLAAFGNVPECEAETKEHRTACKGGNAGPGGCSERCKKAKACILAAKKDDKAKCCHPDKTGHHMIEDHWVKQNANFPNYVSFRVKPRPASPTPAQRAAGKRTELDAPCVCVNASRFEREHQSMHNVQGVYEESFMPGKARHRTGAASGGFTYGEGKKSALDAHDATFPDAGCTRECIAAQLDSFYGTDKDDKALNQPKTQGLGDDRDDTLDDWGSIISG